MVEKPSEHTAAPNPPSQQDHLVVLVHGINTRARWMDNVRPALERANFVVAATSFGNVGIDVHDSYCSVVRMFTSDPLRQGC